MKFFDFRNSAPEYVGWFIIITSIYHGFYNAMWLRLGLGFEKSYESVAETVVFSSEPFLWGALLVFLFDFIGIMIGISMLYGSSQRKKSDPKTD